MDKCLRVNVCSIGFPMMLVTTFAAMIYLLICHVAFDWDITQETKQCISDAQETL